MFGYPTDYVILVLAVVAIGGLAIHRSLMIWVEGLVIRSKDG